MSDYTLVIGILAVTATLVFVWALCRAAGRETPKPYTLEVYDKCDTWPEYGMYGAWCGDCGKPMQIVRPGKYQCCECDKKPRDTDDAE